jgi:hypothetical protein
MAKAKRKLFEGLLWSKRCMIVSADDHCVYIIPVSGLYATPEKVAAAIHSRFPALRLGDIVVQPGDAMVCVTVLYGALAIHHPPVPTYVAKDLLAESIWNPQQ